MASSRPADEAIRRGTGIQLESPRRPPRARVVDLNEVTSIDKSGEEALLMMVRGWSHFVASGVYTRHLLEQLQARQGTKSFSIDFRFGLRCAFTPAFANPSCQCWRKRSGLEPS